MGPGTRSAHIDLCTTDPPDVVSAHRALNSMAVITVALRSVAQTIGDLADVDQFIAPALEHATIVSAVLRDVLLGLPLGATTALAEEDGAQASRRFGLRRATS